MKHLVFLSSLLGLVLPLTAQDADPSAKLSELLRATMLELRKYQTEAVNAQALQAAAEAKNKELEEKLANEAKRYERLAEDLNEEKVTAEKTIGSLHNQLSAAEKRIEEYKEALLKWQDGYNKAAEIARTKEDERATLASEAIELKRTIADRERKNIALFNTAMEILDRFENYSLGKALSAREPFIGSRRVKVENLVEGYKDKVIDNRIAAPAKDQ